MLLCCLSKKGLTTTFELRNYFREKGDLSMQLSIQGYLQQRKRFNPEIFPYLNRNYLMDFYHSDEPKLWKGYLLIAIDGSKAEVPNSKENRETNMPFVTKEYMNFKRGLMIWGSEEIINSFIVFDSAFQNLRKENNLSQDETMMYFYVIETFLKSIRKDLKYSVSDKISLTDVMLDIKGRQTLKNPIKTP